MSATGKRDASGWAGGARGAVVVTVNFDVEMFLISEDPGIADREKTLSVVRYGATRGARRLLDIFRDKGVTATWFVPGRIAETYPAIVREVVAAGHSVAMRGYNFERFDVLDRRAAIDAIRRGQAAIGDLLGSPACGFRLPSGEWPIHLAELLLDEGITWSSSWLGDDLPFYLPGPGKRLLDIPVSYGLDDRIAFFWNLNPPIPAGQPRIPSYAEVLKNWRYELEGCRREGLCFVLQLHPEICGTPGCMGIVRDLLDLAVSSADLALATCDQVAEWWRASRPENEPGHPAEIFFATRPLRHSHRTNLRSSANAPHVCHVDG